MPPPGRPIGSKPLSSQSQRHSLRDQIQAQPVDESDPDPESLFIPDRAHGRDDQIWNPPNYENEDDEMLGWDTSHEGPDASFHPTFRDSGDAPRQPKTVQDSIDAGQEGVEPTQRLSQVCLSVM